MTDDKQSAYLIDPIKFAKELAHFSADLPLKFMKRLAEALNEPELAGSVQIDLQGEVDFERTAYITLHVQGVVGLVCQRCLLPCDHEIDVYSKLAPVKSEKAAKRLPSDYEILMVEEDEMSIIDMVEDELLLCLPSVALHPLEKCSIKQKNWLYGKEVVQEQKENPFAELSKFKIKK